MVLAMHGAQGCFNVGVRGALWLGCTYPCVFRSVRSEIRAFSAALVRLGKHGAFEENGAVWESKVRFESTVRLQRHVLLLCTVQVPFEINYTLLHFRSAELDT